LKNIIIALIVTVAIVGGFLVYQYYGSGAGEAPETTPLTVEPPESYPEDQPYSGIDHTPESTAQGETPSQPPPALNESDSYLVEEYKEKAPFIDEALKGEHLIRKTVAAVDLIRRGENPSSQMGHLKPKGSFEVERRNGKVYVSPKNYARYEPAIKALESLGAEKLVQGYEFLLPLFREAYDELGNERTNWEERALETLDLLLAMEIPEGDMELLDAGGIYIFAEDAYEKLPPAQKILIRMGPENATRVQARLLHLKNMFYR